VATQALFLTLLARQAQTIICVNQDKSGEYRYDENLIKPGNNSPMGYPANAWSP
jgi:hypothetical protein